MQPSGKRVVVISFQPEHLIGWGVTIGLCLVPIVIWAQSHPLHTMTTTSSVLLNIGRVAGLVGTVMYALNLVYATRLRFLEQFFGGLNRVYIAHHLLGGLALIMLSIHPLALALRYLNHQEVLRGVLGSFKQAALMLVPNGLFPLDALFNANHMYHELVLQQWAIFFGIIAFWGMVALLLVTFFMTIPYRLWLFTHKFLGVAFIISALHILFISSDTSKDPLMKGFMLTMVAIGVAAFLYKTVFGNIIIRRYTYTVRDVKTVAGNVVQIMMDPIKQTMSYKPGQFVFIRFRGQDHEVSREWHPFSISSSPTDDGLQLSIKGLGDYTNKLGGLKPGALADIEGAYGRFSYTNYKNTDQVWIGGGIGITPFLSMMKDLPDDGCHVDLYYAVKTESELIDWSLLYGTAMKKPKTLRIIPFVGDKQPKHLDIEFIEKTSGSLKGKDFYICGPPPMMKGLRTQLKAKGIPGTSIHSEEFAMS